MASWGPLKQGYRPETRRDLALGILVEVEVEEFFDIIIGDSETQISRRGQDLKVDSWAPLNIYSSILKFVPRYNRYGRRINGGPEAPERIDLAIG